MKNAIKFGFGFAFGYWLFLQCKNLVDIAVMKCDKKEDEEES